MEPFFKKRELLEGDMISSKFQNKQIIRNGVVGARNNGRQYMVFTIFFSKPLKTSISGVMGPYL